MSGKQKEIISDKTLIIWIVLSALSTIACLLATAVVLYIMYDCWIMYQHQLAGGVCTADFNIEVVFAILIVTGLIIATVVTREALIKSLPVLKAEIAESRSISRAKRGAPRNDNKIKSLRASRRNLYA